MPDPRRVVLGVSIAAGAAYLQPATHNYLGTPMRSTCSHAFITTLVGSRRTPA